MKLPPVDFLLVCSGVSLRDFELSRLNLAANLRKDLHGIQDALLQAEGEALLARWLIECREEMLSAGRARELQTSFEFQPHLALPPAPAPAKSVRRKSNSSRREICA
jgi:hypothetical protein